MNTKAQQWKGRIKQAPGSLTGNKKLDGEGRADRRAAEAKERLAKAKGTVEDVIDEAANSLGDAIDTATDSMPLPSAPNLPPRGAAGKAPAMARLFAWTARNHLGRPGVRA